MNGSLGDKMQMFNAKYPQFIPERCVKGSLNLTLIGHSSTN